MMLSNVALWQAVDELLGLELPTVIVGGGGYNPWTVTRYWTGLWGRISGQQVPDALPQRAVELLRDMECDLVDEEDVDVSWYNKLADTPNPGPVRESVKSLAHGISL
jgi:acetoin utilization protein AcuC